MLFIGTSRVRMSKDCVKSLLIQKNIKFLSLAQFKSYETLFIVSIDQCHNSIPPNILLNTWWTYWRDNMDLYCFLHIRLHLFALSQTRRRLILANESSNKNVKKKFNKKYLFEMQKFK